MVRATRGSRRMLRVFWYSVRCALTSSSPSGVDCRATQTTDTCGLPSGLMVTSVASAPFPMRVCAESSSFINQFYRGEVGFVPGSGFGQGAQDFDDVVLCPLLVDAEPVQGAAVLLGFEQCEQDVLGADVVVPQSKCFAERQLEDFAGRAAEGDQRRHLFGGRRQCDRGEGRLGVDALACQKSSSQRLRVRPQREQEVAGLDLVVACRVGLVLGLD